jgi:hypothetical protein
MLLQRPAMFPGLKTGMPLIRPKSIIPRNVNHNAMFASAHPCRGNPIPPLTRREQLSDAIQEFPTDRVPRARKNLCPLSLTVALTVDGLVGIALAIIVWLVAGIAEGWLAFFLCQIK